MIGELLSEWGKIDRSEAGWVRVVAEQSSPPLGAGAAHAGAIWFDLYDREPLWLRHAEFPIDTQIESRLFRGTELLVAAR